MPILLHPTKGPTVSVSDSQARLGYVRSPPPHLPRTVDLLTRQRATSESWIDFCPKRVFDTTVKGGVEGCVTDDIDNKVGYRVPAAASSAEGKPLRRALNDSTAATAGCSRDYGRRYNGAMNIAVVGRELASVAPAPISPPTASPPSLPVPSTSEASPSPASGAQPQPPPKTQRFDAVDYEASAILLECRSGALLPRHLRGRSP